MAEQALKKLEEQLNCPICLDTYTDPKKLECHHVFCHQCLVPLVVRDQQGQLGLSCPNCHHVTPIPNRGVAGLQPAFYINHFLEIQDSLKNLADLIETSVESTAETPPRNVFRCCFKHVKEELRLYCDTCEELVCLQCIMKGGKHHDHEYTLLNELHEAFEKHKKEIALSLEPMEMQMTSMKKALTLLGTCSGEISDQRAATKDNIHVAFERLREVLNVRETELNSHLDKLTQGKLKSLALQKDQIETTLAQLSSCILLIRESLRIDNEKYLLMMKTNTIVQMKALTNLFRPHLLEPCTKADMAFSATEEPTAKMCVKYGKVFVPAVDPSKCYTTGNGVKEAVVGEMSSTILRPVNFEGDPYKGHIKSLECEFTSKLTGATTHCSVKRSAESQYEISYMPTIKGRHQLHIKAEGEHIRGSPFSVAVTSPSLKFDAPVLTIGALAKPWGVAVTQGGEIVVSEIDGHCVSVFSADGKKLRSFGTYGYSEHGGFDEPRGLTVDGEGNILVADCRNHRIQRFTVEGRFLEAVGTHGSGDLQFSSPSRIEYNSSNNKFYVADANCRIQILNSDLNFCGTFGGPGTGMGLFHSDYILGGIACDSTGNVYVTDFGNTRIQVFTPEGEFLRIIGKRGHGEGELYCPVSVAVDSKDLVYVSENGNQRISVFTSEGQFVTSRDGLNRPRGLAVDKCGLVYVCDTENKCVKVF